VSTGGVRWVPAGLGPEVSRGSTQIDKKTKGLVIYFMGKTVIASLACNVFRGFGITRYCFDPPISEYLG
jgi:hypothetical protein